MEISILKGCIEKLKASLLELSNEIEKSPSLFVTTDGEFLTGIEAIELAKQGFSDIEVADGAKDGRFTSVYLGAIAGSSRTLAVAEQVNAAKHDLQVACKAVMDSFVSPDGQKLSSTTRSKRLRAALKDAECPRLSLRQCFRRIRIIYRSPHSIRFSYSSGGRSVKRLSHGDVLRLIDNVGRESLMLSIQADNALKSPSGVKFAQVQDLAGYYKANVLHQAGDDPDTLAAFLPIIYLHDEGRAVLHSSGLPDPEVCKNARLDREQRILEHNRASQPKDRRSVSRSDRTLSDEPLIPALRIYRVKTRKPPKKAVKNPPQEAGQSSNQG